jgi:hypothetical protein
LKTLADGYRWLPSASVNIKTMGSVFYRWFILVHIGFPQRRKHCSIVPAKSSRQLRKTAGRQPLHDDALHFQDLAMQLHFPHRITCGSGMLAD